MWSRSLSNFGTKQRPRAATGRNLISRRLGLHHGCIPRWNSRSFSNFGEYVGARTSPRLWAQLPRNPFSCRTTPVLAIRCYSRSGLTRPLSSYPCRNLFGWSATDSPYLVPPPQSQLLNSISHLVYMLSIVTPYKDPSSPTMLNLRPHRSESSQRLTSSSSLTLFVLFPFLQYILRHGVT